MGYDSEQCDHDWRTVTVEVYRNPSLTDRAIQECRECGRFRKTPMEWVDEDE